MANQPEKEWFEEELGMLVRDVTQVGSIPKSAAKRRIKELIAEATRRGKVEMLAEIKNLVEHTKLWSKGTVEGTRQDILAKINSRIQQYGKEE